jgi:IS30 family transposase
MALLKHKRYSLRDIARALSRSVSTISDEFRRNRVQGVYDPRKAQHKAYVRRKYSKYQGMKVVASKDLQAFVDELLWDDQSPQAIAGRLKNQPARLPRVSKASVYRYIESPYGRRLEHHRQRLRRRRHRKPRTKPWADRTFIDQRPAHINKRQRVGDAEGDFIVSGKSGRGVLLVVVSRKHRYGFLEGIQVPSLSAVTRACLKIKQRFPEWTSLTTDNDLLFQHHALLERVLGIKIYFCFPGHAWEKGTVENVNKWLRRYVPKGSNLSRYSKRFFKKLEQKLNRRILGVLNHRTPAECLTAYRKRKNTQV